MQLDNFIRSYRNLWDADPETADHPKDRRFRKIIDETGGMATENKLQLLNYAASYLDPGREVYLEIGTYLGTSVIGAADGADPFTEFVAIDNFSLFGGPQDECEANIRTSNAKIRLIPADGFMILTSRLFEYKIGVYFYDGGHLFSEQWKGLQLVEPHLTDEAIVLVDDASHPPVAAANREFLRLNPRFTRIERFDSPRNAEPRWWNGVDLIAYRRHSAPPGSPPDARAKAVAAAMGTPYEWAHNTLWPKSVGNARRVLRKLRPNRSESSSR